MARNLSIAIGVGLLSLCAAAARADAAYDACLKPAVTNQDFDICGASYLKRADLRLNAAWRAAFALASGQTRTDLLAEQRAWIVFKDKSCLLYANGDQGREGQVISFPGCRGNVIDQRATALKAIAADLAPK